MTSAAVLGVVLSLGTLFSAAHEPTVSNVTVEEGGNIILQCSLNTKDNQTFDWKKDDSKEVFLYAEGRHYNNGRQGQEEEFKGRVSHFQEELKNGNASITIRRVKVTDSGKYTCDLVMDGKAQRMAIIWLVVNHTLKDRSAENIPGASPKPVTTIVDATEDGVQLKCEVIDAFPEPEVFWQDSEGSSLHGQELQVSESGGRFNVSLVTTVTKTKTNLFHCVAKQHKINHEIFTEIYVPKKMFEDCKSSGQVNGRDVLVWAAMVSLGILIGVGATVIFFRIKSKRDLTQHQNEEHVSMRGICNQCQRPMETNGHVSEINENIQNGSVQA